MLKSRKKLLEESDEELFRIRKSLKVESKWAGETWYSKIGMDEFKNTIERNNITEKDFLEKLEFCIKVSEKNEILGVVDKIKKSSKLYDSLVKMADPLKENKSLYSWYIKLLELSVNTVFLDYGMDHVMVLNYILKNKRPPKKTSLKENSTLSMSLFYYMKNKYKTGASHWLIQIAKSILLGM